MAVHSDGVTESSPGDTQLHDKQRIKGALGNFGEVIQTQNLYINDINEVMIQTQNYFSFSVSE